MKVLKFGGTSVGSPQRMRNLVPLVSKEKPVLVVLSAVTGTTNNLVEISNFLKKQDKAEAYGLIEKMEKQYSEFINDLLGGKNELKEAEQVVALHFNHIKELAEDLFTIFEERTVLAKGELISTALFHLYLKSIGIESCLLPALDFMKIDENEEPDLTFISTHIQKILDENKGFNLYITQGYICRNSFGQIDNLKRGGSDYSASLIGAAIEAAEIQIWTDIDGMHNNDPRHVKNTSPIAELSFDEAAELAYFGAKILHPSSVLPAKLKKIPVRLLNTMQPEAKGTTISDKSSGDSIKAVAAKDGITAIKIKSGRMLLAYGFLRSVFEVFEIYKTPIDMITTSEVAVSLTIDNDTNLDKIIADLNKFGTVEVEKDQTIICIVGDFLADKQGYGLKVFQSLKDIPIRMISYGGSANNISLLINTDNKIKALQAINKGVFEKHEELV